MEHNEHELKCLSFLRYLYNETRMNPVIMSLCAKGQEYEIGNYNVMAIKLVELGILKKEGSGKQQSYRWIEEDGPSLDMVKKLNQAVSDYSKRDVKKTEQSKPNIVNPSPKTNPNPPVKFSEKKERKFPGHSAPPPPPPKSTKLPIETLAAQLSIDQVCELCRLKGLSGTLEVKTTINI